LDEEARWNKVADICCGHGGRQAVVRSQQDVEGLTTLWNLIPYLPDMMFVGLRLEYSLWSSQVFWCVVTAVRQHVSEPAADIDRERKKACFGFCLSRLKVV
jgi:hypothetical protein